MVANNMKNNVNYIQSCKCNDEYGFYNYANKYTNSIKLI